MLEDLYIFMYDNHPDCDERFECTQSFGTLSTMKFSATGGPVEHAELREWIADIFIPFILPDLNTEAARIVGAEKLKALSSSLDGTSDNALIEVMRDQLCPDASELTFVKRFVDDIRKGCADMNNQDDVDPDDDE